MKNSDDFRSQVGARLKSFIKKEGITQTEFADKLQIANTTLSAVLRGKNGISSDLAHSIINIYPELSWNWLFKGAGVMTGDEVEIIGKVKEPETKNTNIALLEERIRGLEKEVALKDEIITLLKGK